jgi:outer membrane receptor protein involved in Fe transport
MKLRTAILLLSGIILNSTVQAQKSDSTLTLDPIVVTAERVASTLSSSTVGVSVLSARDLRHLPSRNASSLLGFIQGMTFLDFDGLGFAPQSVTRGFYGGGEAEYVVVLVNGKPINNLENGLVNWEQITTAPGTSVEVLRGGASSLYGDAAIGAVINVRTDQPLETSRFIRASGGNLGILNAHASILSNRYSALADFSSSDGFRDHSGRQSVTLQGSYRLIDVGGKSLSLSASLNQREFDTPGPLRSTDQTRDGIESLAFFQFDNVDEQTIRTSLDGGWDLSEGRIDASFTGEFRDQDQIRTLPLSVDFADTQERQVDAAGFKTSLMVSDLSLPIPIDNQLVFGVDGFIGTLDSRYRHIVTGGLGDYLGASGTLGDVLSDGTASRKGVAGYAHLELNPTNRLNVSLGARMDWIEDSFDEVSGLSEAEPSASHTAFSPKAGLNYRYSSSASQVGNVYVSLSRSFKAPTLDQLYDLRAFPVPFPPYSIQIANADLVPQEGTSYEIGFYHQLAGSDGWSTMISSSLYSIDMTNEIDFSFDTFSNVNIGKSRHRGIETGIRTEKNQLGSAFLNYTLQDVTSRKGENKGNAVKAIPRHAFSGGIVADLGSVSASVVLKGNRKTYVDDANTKELPDYATVDFRVAFTRNAYTLTLDVFNALDRAYDSTAYQDPGGSEALFVFPAAMRTLSIGFELRL